MNKVYDESEGEFSLEFDGESYIYADTLLTTINNITELLQYITSNKNPDAISKLKITKFDSGSFDINLQAIIYLLPTIINPTTVKFANDVISLLINSFELKKHLKGEKPKNVVYKQEKAVVTNQCGEELIADKDITKTYFGNDTIDANIVNIFNVIVPDSGKSGLTIKQNHGKTVKIERQDFKSMATKVVMNDNISETLTNIINVNLLLRKPDLLGNSQWGFWFTKNINVTIKDESWLEKVHSRQIRNLYTGVRIPAKLQIEYDLDKYKNPIPNSERYTILEITGDVIEPDNNEQIKMG